MHMIRNSLCSRLVVFVLTVSVSGFVHPGASFAQEISGGASVLLASADVEAKLGKGIFGSPPNRKHVKRPPPKTVVRSSHATRPTTSTIPRTKPETEKPAEVSHRTGESTKPPADPIRRLPTAETFNKQGDDFFDAGQYQKAVDAYQQAIHLQANYPEAYLNLGEAYFNLSRYDDAVTAEKQAILQKPDWAASYTALGNAYLKLDRSAEAVETL